MSIVSAQCIIGNEKYPDFGIFLNFDDDNYSEGHHQIKEVFRAFTHDDVLQPFISENDFRSNNDGDNTGYYIHAFDIRYQKHFQTAQPIKVEYNFDGVIDAAIYGYALVLTNKLVSISSDGQRMFDVK